MTFDFAALADGLTQNNVGLGGIELVADVVIEKGTVKLAPTGQVFRLKGAAPDASAPTRHKMRVLDGTEPSRTALEIEE